MFTKAINWFRFKYWLLWCRSRGIYVGAVVETTPVAIQSRSGIHKGLVMSKCATWVGFGDGCWLVYLPDYDDIVHLQPREIVGIKCDDIPLK
jgi:hypothetical protein